MIQPGDGGRPRRLSGQAAFQRLFRLGTTVRGEWLALTALPNGSPHTRFGCAIRRQAASGSVFRNRLKRWLREAVRRNQGVFPRGLDLVAVVSKSPVPPSFQTVERALLALASQPKLSSGLSGFTRPRASAD